VINDNKSKHSKKSLETLIALREEIKLQKTKKGLLPLLVKLAKICGLLPGGDDD